MEQQTLDAGIYQVRRNRLPKIVPQLPTDPTERALQLARILGDIAQDPSAHLNYDIQKLLALQESTIWALARNATEDELTGALNLRGYHAEAPKLMDVTRRLEGHLIYAIADIDHFKKINDSYGHRAGDQALSLFGKAAKETLRSGDLIARIGGDEFVIMLPTPSASTLGRETLMRITERYAALLASTVAPPTTLSFGTSSYDHDVKHIENYERMPVHTLLNFLKERADRRLYLAKQQRDTIVEVDRAA